MSIRRVCKVLNINSLFIGWLDILTLQHLANIIEATFLIDIL